MHVVAIKFVPRILTADQKQQHVNVCEELHQTASNDVTFFSRLSVVMRAEYIVMTPKQSNNPLNGKDQTHQS
jgi:hypothetical protein